MVGWDNVHRPNKTYCNSVARRLILQVYLCKYLVLARLMGGGIFLKRLHFNSSVVHDEFMSRSFCFGYTFWSDVSTWKSEMIAIATAAHAGIAASSSLTFCYSFFFKLFFLPVTHVLPTAEIHSWALEKKAWVLDCEQLNSDKTIAHGIFRPSNLTSPTVPMRRGRESGWEPC